MSQEQSSYYPSPMLVFDTLALSNLTAFRLSQQFPPTLLRSILSDSNVVEDVELVRFFAKHLELCPQALLKCRTLTKHLLCTVSPELDFGARFCSGTVGRISHSD